MLGMLWLTSIPSRGGGGGGSVVILLVTSYYRNCVNLQLSKPLRPTEQHFILMVWNATVHVPSLSNCARYCFARRSRFSWAVSTSPSTPSSSKSSSLSLQEKKYTQYHLNILKDTFLIWLGSWLSWLQLVWIEITVKILTMEKTIRNTICPNSANYHSHKPLEIKECQPWDWVY